MKGGDGSDTYVWNGTGDGVDTLSSLSGYDRVRVQGSAVANNFVVSQNNGQLRITDGVAVLNVSPVIQVVDILAGGGDDTITIGTLDRVRTATLLTVNGGDGNDTINSNGREHWSDASLVDRRTRRRLADGQRGHRLARRRRRRRCAGWSRWQRSDLCRPG